MKKKNCAFTLAEVLITLAIIGVVAALTLPTLIQKYTEKATVTKVKKAYSLIAQAYQLAINDLGTMDNWGIEGSQIEKDEEGNSFHSTASYESADKFFQIMQNYIKGAKYEPLGPNPAYPKTTATKGGLILPDGTAIRGAWLVPSKCFTGSECADLYITTNGEDLEKVENGQRKYSKYAFNFILKSDSVIPSGNSASEFNANCLTRSNNTRCTAWVIKNGNMDYLHCPNELDWNTTTKCK